VHSDHDLYEKIEQIISYLKQIINLQTEVKKLQKHPIKDWMEYISSELLCDEINVAHLMINNKEISELFDDFKESKNTKLKNIVISVKKLSDEIVENYVDKEFKERYLASYHSSTKNFDKDEMQNIRFLNDID
jgi:CRISPR/Cas system CSM-associated protein Csm4 (group 5 of RAMP superfamily)